MVQLKPGGGWNVGPERVGRPKRPGSGAFVKVLENAKVTPPPRKIAGSGGIVAKNLSMERDAKAQEANLRVANTIPPEPIWYTPGEKDVALPTGLNPGGARPDRRSPRLRQPRQPRRQPRLKRLHVGPLPLHDALLQRRSRRRPTASLSRTPRRRMPCCGMPFAWRRGRASRTWTWTRPRRPHRQRHRRMTAPGPRAPAPAPHDPQRRRGRDPQKKSPMK